MWLVPEVLWRHRMTQEEIANGGIWVVGNFPYCGERDYPGKQEGILVKSWQADPRKYGGGYPPKDRAEENHWEYVRVLSGTLRCELGTGDKPETFYDLSYPNDGVDIAPSMRRSWVLPSGCLCAAGITILRRLDCRAPMPGAGKGYDYRVFQLGLHSQCILAEWPSADAPDWTWMYMEVFAGRFTLLPEGDVLKEVAPLHRRLAVGDHVICRRGIPLTVLASEANSVAVVIRW